MNPLPADPYLALGVSKTAQLSEIRSAHRKLVLKCHPDKVQDEALKLAKQDEFQKVQQAYELLSNEAQRAQYDQQAKLIELRKEMGRSGSNGAGPVPGAGANVYYAEPRTSSSASYRTKPTSSRYETDESRYPAPRKASSYETKAKSLSKDEERRMRRKEEERQQDARREAESKREKDAVYSNQKKSRDKERRKASEDKSRSSYIERSESDSEDSYRPTKSAPRIRLADLVDILPKSTSRRTTEIVDGAERRKEKTRATMEHAYQYMKAASRVTAANNAAAAAEPLRGAKVAYVPDSPVIDTIAEEDDSVRRSSGRTPRRTSVDTPSSSRRGQNSSHSRESPMLSSRDKKKSDPRIIDADLPPRTKPSLSSQKSAPPEIPSNREKPHRSSTYDTYDPKYNSKGSHVTPSLPRASTFNGNESHKSSRRPIIYPSESESDSESDSPVYKQASPTRERPPIQKTSSYKIIKDLNGKRAERVHNLSDVYEAPRDRSLSPKRPVANYPRTSSSRPISSRAPHSQQPAYAASQFIPVPSSLPPDRDVPTVKTVRPGMRETQSHSQWAKKPAAMYDEVKVSYAPNYGREDVSYSQDYTRGNNPEAGFSSYPAVNQAYKREEVAPRKMTYVS